jgi:hypothetical protein
MRQDSSHAVPVVVTVGHPAGHPSPPHATPGTSLPFSGSYVELLLVAGLGLTTIGTALATAVRRRAAQSTGSTA